MNEQVPSNTKLSDIDLSALIRAYNAGGITHGFVPEVYRCLVELQQMREDWKTICEVADAMPTHEPPVKLVKGICSICEKEFEGHPGDNACHPCWLGYEGMTAEELAGTPPPPRDELLEIAREVSTLDCFYTGDSCPPACECLSARSGRAIQPTSTKPGDPT